MTYDQLLTLENVVKLGSFKAAADFMHKTQPSLSVAIKKLEEEFQIQLFDRSGYRPVLTAEGELFYQKTKKALLHYKQLELFGTELGLGVEPEIKIGIDGLAPLNSLLCTLREFFEQNKQTKLTLVMGMDLGTQERLAKEEIDLAIGTLNISDPEVQRLKISTTKMIPVIKSNLASQFSSVEQLREFPQIVVTDNYKNSSQTYGVLDEARRWDVTEMKTKQMIIEEGLGWGRLPHFLIEEKVTSGLLKIIDLPELETFHVPIYLSRKKSRAIGPMAKLLWKCLGENHEI